MEKLTAPIQISPNKMEHLVSKKVTQDAKIKALRKKQLQKNKKPETDAPNLEAN